MANNKKDFDINAKSGDNTNQVDLMKNGKLAKEKLKEEEKLTSRICIATTKQNSDAIKEVAYQKRMSVNNLLNQLIKDCIDANRGELNK